MPTAQPPTATPPPGPPTATRTPAPTATPEPPQVAFAASTLTVAERQRQLEVEVRLSKSYFQPVTVSYSSSDGGSATPGVDYVRASGTLTFTAGVQSQRFTVRVVEDALNEPDEGFVITLTSPINATLGDTSALVVTITDSDPPPTVAFSTAGQSVDEGVGSAAATISLSAPSAIDVTIPYVVRGSAGLDDHALRSGTVIIPAGAASARLRFAITPDRVDEDDETIAIFLGTPTNAQLGAPSIHELTIVDDDTAGVQFAPATLNVAERDGAPATYTVVLLSQPVAPVRVEVQPDDQLTIAPASLTFTPQDWATPQTVTVRAVDDRVDEAEIHVVRLAHTPSSADPRYDALRDLGPVTVRIADDDTADITLSTATLMVSEDPAAANHAQTYTIVLESQPIAPVRIALTTVGAQIAVSPASLEFTATSWSTPQTVTVTAVDDDIDERDAHFSAVGHAVASADPNYDSFTVPAVAVTIIDNDSAGVAVAPTDLTLSERPTAPNNTQPYAIVLTSQPLAPVQISVAADARVTLEPTSLTFTADNWRTPQTVIVSARDNFVDAPDALLTITHGLTSADPNYSPLRPDAVNVRILDDDSAGVTLTPIRLDLREDPAAPDNAGAYTIRLTSEPVATVELAIAPDTELTASAPSLIFTPANWATPQAVTLRAIDDAVDEDGDDNRTPHIGFVIHGITSADPNYDDSARAFTIPVVTASIVDNDTRGIRLSPASLTVGEGGVLTYTVRLESRPRSPITLALSASPGGLIDLSDTTLSFTPGTWATPQTVTVTANDNFVDAPDAAVTISHTAAGADPVYSGLSAASSVTVDDDDTAGALIVPDTLALSEDPAAPDTTGTYTIRLTSEPVAPVRILLSPDAEVTVDAPSLLFTAADWDTPQTVTVTAADDAVDEASPHPGAVRHRITSADTTYSGLMLPDTTVAITDDDTAAIVVDPLGLATVEGGVVSYTVRLESQPTAPVTITAAPAPAGLVALGPGGVTFTPLNWSVLQTVTVTAIDNFVDAPDATATISHTVTSADLIYRGLTVDQVVIAIADDDTADVLLSIDELEVNELRTAPDHRAAYTVRLGSRPTAPVSLTLSFDPGQLTITPTELTFTPATWNISQTVTVAAFDDFDLDGPQTRTIRHTIVSDDPRYDGMADRTVTARILDDDQAGLDPAPATLALSESITGTQPISGLIELQLRSRPTAPVTVTLVPDAQLTVGTPALIFTPDTWSVPQQVALTAVDDPVDETTPHTGTLDFTLSSPDPFYDARRIPPYQVAIEDDDTAALVVTPPTALSTSEGGGAITFTVRLATRPLSPVQLNVLIDRADEATVSSPAMPLRFTDADWDAPVAITVIGLDDAEYDGQTSFEVRFAVEGDPVYAALSSATLPWLALVNDDDEPALASLGDPAPLSEGDSGLRTLRFPVSLRRASPVTVTLSYATADLSATGGEDYLVTTGTLTLPPGITSTMIGVKLIGDTDFEPDEMFALRLTGASALGDIAGIGDGQAVGVIRNDDVPTVRFAAGDLLVRESAGVATVAVRLDAPRAAPVVVGYTTVANGSLAGTATFGQDYQGVSGFLTFDPGEVERTFTLPILDNDGDPEERYETVRLSLFSSTGLPIGVPGVMSVTIEEDGTPASLADAAFLSTAGPLAAPGDGYWYTGQSAGAANYVQLIVPCGWSAGTPLTVELWSPAIHTEPGSLDVILDPSLAVSAGATRFELYGPGADVGLDGVLIGAPAPLLGRSYNPTTAAEGWEPLGTLSDPAPCGRYLLRTTASDADENQWAVRADGASLASLLTTVEQRTPAGVQACGTGWVLVPADAARLRLRTFDLDSGAGAGADPEALVRYYRPGEPFDPQARLGGLAGTASGDGAWAEDGVISPRAGWWRAVLCTSGRNRFSFEASADGQPLATHFEAPASMPELSAELTVTPERAVPDAPLTVTARYLVGADGPAGAVELSFALPPEVSLDGDPCAAAAVPCVVTRETLTLTVGDLAPGQEGTFSFVVTPRSEAVGQQAAVGLTARFRDELGYRRQVRAGALATVE